METRYVNDREIAILMATYNGEKYVSEQIESIISQIYNDFTLYIRDDNSSDSTPQIIQYYAKKYPEKIVVIEGGKNIGSKRGFLYLLELVNSKYYMFSDQDDVWKKDKIEKSIGAIKEIELNNGETPCIVHSDLELVDGNLNLIAPSYWKHCHLLVGIPHSFQLFCHFNDITGCTMLFNHKVTEIARPFLKFDLPYFIHHDHFLGLIVSKERGIIYPIYETLILFRRHGNNSTNPLIKRKSIFQRPMNIVAYIKDLYYRLKFYRQIDRYPMALYIINKIKITIIRSQWKKRKQE